MTRTIADGRFWPMKYFLPDPKMLSEGYWRSTLFSDSSVLETMKENENQVGCDK